MVALAASACSSSSGTSPPADASHDVTQTHDSGADTGTARDGGADGAKASDAGHEASLVDAGIGLTCGALLNCDNACSSSACTDECFDQATAVAQGLFDALTLCIADNCSADAGGPCASPSSSACSSCNEGAAVGACISNLEKCEQDKTVAPPDPDGGVVVANGDAGSALNCGQYTQCLAACTGDAGSCVAACAARATSEASALAGQLKGCLATACPAGDGGVCETPGTACNGCVEQTEFGGTCSSAYTSCQSDTSTSPDASTTPVVLNGGPLSALLRGVDQIGSTMLVQDGYLYFAQENVSQQVGRIWVGDGGVADAGVSHVGVPQPTPVAITVDSTDVYVWNYGTFTGMSSINNNNGTVVRIPLDGGAQSTVQENVQVFYAAPYLNAITHDTQNLYWVEGASGNDGVIMKSPLGTSNGTAIYTQQNFPEGVVTDGTNVYWASWGTFNADGDSNNDGTIQQGSVNGGSVVTLASNLSAPACLALDANNIYWTNLGKMGGDNLPALNTGSVMQVPIGGGTVVTIASGESVPVGIVVAGSNIYWTEYGLGSPGLVLTAPKGGGTVEPLVANLRNPYSLAVTSNTLYWTLYGASTPTSTTTLIDSLNPY